MCVLHVCELVARPMGLGNFFLCKEHLNRVTERTTVFILVYNDKVLQMYKATYLT